MKDAHRGYLLIALLVFPGCHGYAQQEGTRTQWNAHADVNSDGAVDHLDLFILAGSWQTGEPEALATPTPVQTPTVTPTPTPTVITSLFEGSYAIEYRGDDDGTALMMVDAWGLIVGTLQDSRGTIYGISGSVSAVGDVRFTCEMAEFAGLLSWAIGGGTWHNEINEQDGTWTAERIWTKRSVDAEHDRSRHLAAGAMWRAEADLNGDGIVNGLDLLALMSSWHTLAPSGPPTPAATPPLTATPTVTPTNTRRVYTSPFEGSYNLGFRGDDTGTALLRVSSSGTISGSLQDSGAFVYDLRGTVTYGGQLNFTYGRLGGYTGSFNGTLELSGTGFGRWENIHGENGSWTAQKIWGKRKQDRLPAGGIPKRSMGSARSEASP